MKISNLPAFTGELNGSEQLPVNKAGTKRITAAQIAALGQAVGIEGAAVIASILETLGQSDALEKLGYKFGKSGLAQMRPFDEKADETVPVTEFGVRIDGSAAANALALQKARDFAALRSYDGNSVELLFPPGRIIADVWPDWAIDRLHLRCIGESWWINEQADSTLKVDGGAVGDGVHGLQVTGYPQIYGGPASSHGMYGRAVFNSKFEVNVRGAGGAFSGFYFEWMVDNALHLICSSNEAGLYSTPNRGITMTGRGPAEETSYNDMYVKMAGTPVGCYIDAGLGNKFWGGSFQSHLLGVQLTPNAWEQYLNKTDFEGNLLDVEDSAKRTQYDSTDMDSGLLFKSAAVGATVEMGRIETIQRESGGAEHILLMGVAYNRKGSGQIIDPDLRFKYMALRNIAANTMHDTPRLKIPLAVTVGNFTYTNNGTAMQFVQVKNGTVINTGDPYATGLIYSRDAGEYLNVYQGIIPLAPKDSLIIPNTDPPSVIVYT